MNFLIIKTLFFDDYYRKSIFFNRLINYLIKINFDEYSDNELN